MTKFKYRVDKPPALIHASTTSSNYVASWLEQMAAEGWLLVTCYAAPNSPYTSDGTSPRFVFKREGEE